MMKMPNFPSHWYKQRRTASQRRRIYNHLRKQGASMALARRARDWSKNHVRLLIESYLAAR